MRNKGLEEELSMEELYSVLLTMLKHRGISYLDDAIDDSKGGNYSKAIALNQKELVSKYPCQIQLERLQKYGKYRGDMTVEVDGSEEYHSNVFTKESYVLKIISLVNLQMMVKIL